MKLLLVFVWKQGNLGNEDPVFGIYLTTLAIAITKIYNIISSNWKSSSKNWKVLIGISEEDISEEDISEEDGSEEDDSEEDVFEDIFDQNISEEDLSEQDTWIFFMDILKSCSRIWLGCCLGNFLAQGYM